MRGNFGRLKPGNVDVVVSGSDNDMRGNEIISLRVASDIPTDTLNLDTVQSVFRKVHTSYSRGFGQK